MVLKGRKGSLSGAKRREGGCLYTDRLGNEEGAERRHER